MCYNQIKKREEKKDMGRYKWLLCACLILALVLLPVHANAEAETTNWVTSYERVLTAWNDQISEYPDNADTVPELSYLVYDIDKDSIPEMLVKFGTCEADYLGAIYAIQDGEVFQVGEEFGLAHSSFYSDPGENGIILMSGHMGFAYAERISLKDGYIEELLYEDDLNTRLQEDPNAEYIYPGDVIPGSVSLTLCRGNVILPLTHYEEISRCLEGVQPSAAKGQYPNQDTDFFESLISANGEVYAVTADGFTNDPGRIGFQELLRQNVVANWMQGDLSILSATPGDLNGDGQLECFIAASDGGSEIRIILSEQDGTVFAYLINYTDGYVLDSDGCIFCPSPYYPFRYRLIFDREQAFLLDLPIG